MKQTQLKLDECEGFPIIRAQRTLDGKPLYLDVSDTDFVKIVNQFTIRNPQRFAEYCVSESMAYHGKPHMLNTLKCCKELQDYFGFFTKNMVNALAAYPIED